MATLAAVTLLYATSILVATYPAVLRCRSQLPVLLVADPVQHLFLFRWYERCLTEGRSPLVCPEIHYPVGAPLGLLTPLQLQSVIYLLISPFTDNDILAYNLILFAEFLFTGLGTFALAWHLTRHRWGATISGLVAMLSGGMLINAMGGGTELLALGGFPLFLVGWMRFVDRPNWRSLGLAAGLFLLLAASAPYYGVIGVIPAVLYVLGRVAGQGRRDRRAWAISRVGWLASFSLIVGLAVPVLFAAHVWTVLEGESLARPRSEFQRFNTTVWHYVIPWATHHLNLLLPPFWSLPGINNRATVYLGVVTICLLAYAVIHGVRFPRSRYLWATLGVMVVLSLGAYSRVGSTRIPLPALWLWEVCPPFRSLRVPARFGYFATVCAAVIAAGAVKHAFGRIARPRRRAAAGVALVVLAVADLAMAPFPTQPLPTMPACYDFIRQRDPAATIYEVHADDRPVDYQALCAYWQGFHGLKTSAGYTGSANQRYQQTIHASSPFPFERLGDGGFLVASEAFSMDLLGPTRFEDYTWLFLTAHEFDYLVLHRWTWEGRAAPESLDRIAGRLGTAIVYQDDSTVVVDRSKLPAPTDPVLLCTTGWRQRLDWRGRRSGVVAEDARLVVYNPTPDRALRLQLDAASYLEPRTVHLRSNETDLASWQISPRESSTFTSPAFRLPAGLHELALRSDGASRPRKPRYAPVEGDMKPFSLWVQAVSLTAGESPTAESVAAQADDESAATTRR